jgi:hypothetical protein
MTWAEPESDLGHLMESRSREYVRRRTEEQSAVQERFRDRFAEALERISESSDAHALEAGLHNLAMSGATDEARLAAISEAYGPVVDDALRAVGLCPDEVARELFTIVGQPEGSGFKGAFLAIALALRLEPPGVIGSDEQRRGGV